MDVERVFEVESRQSHESVKAVFSDEEVSDMRCYVSRFNELLESRQDGLVYADIKAKISNDRLDWLIACPSSAECAVFLHRMRPFILNDERTYFGRIKGIIERRFVYKSINAVLSQVGASFSVKKSDTHPSLHYGGRTYNIDDILRCWLNSCEYHTGNSTRNGVNQLDVIEQFKRIMPIEGIRVICLRRLNEQYDSIYKLYNFVDQMLRYPRARYVLRNDGCEQVIDIIPMD